VRLEGELKGEEGEERGRASGRSAERANGPQPLARNAISCRYFRSGLGGGLAWKGAAKPKKNGIHPSACGNAHLLLPRGSRRYRG
jgi:hypothetical protein